jgi:REP element-mobilizing transposase RayT
MKNKHRRKNIRLAGYDYKQSGAYFVTIVTQNRECLFGEIVDGGMRLNEAGKVVAGSWAALPNHYANTGLDEFVVMPNHIHGIITLQDCVGAGLKPAPTMRGKRHGLSEIVRALKTFSARNINALRQTPGLAVWQRNYHEHVIRNEKSLERIRQYIQDNPLRWAFDRENPAALNPEPRDAWRE